MPMVTRRFTILMLIALVAIMLAGPVYAQTPPGGDQTPPTGSAPLVTSISLNRLGFPERILRGPFDFTQYTFGFPADWVLGSGTEIELNIAAYPAIGHNLGGIIEMVLNSQSITTIAIDWVGPRTITIPIPAEALVTTRLDGRHELRFNLSSSVDCENPSQVELLLQNSSVFILPHDEGRPPITLANLPYPIFQRTFTPDTALIVVPDQPSAGELQAALTVAAGFSRISFGGLDISLVALGGLTEELRSAHHLIFVGRTGAFPFLNLPAPAAPAATDEESAGSEEEAVADDSRPAPDSGILRMIPSPWNVTRVILVVTGDEDAGVIKGAQAISTGAVRTANDPAYAVITDVSPSQVQGLVSLIEGDFNAAGYPTRVFQSAGRSSAEYTFFIRPGLRVIGDTYLDLFIGHSTLLNYARSGLVVSLNGEPIGSVRFSDETAVRISDDTETLGAIRLNFAPSALRIGNNTLRIDAELTPQSACFDGFPQSTWLTIRGESSLHVPLADSLQPTYPIISLREYPSPFSLEGSLFNTTFVLPLADPAAWDAAVQVAADLGNRTRSPLIEMTAVYADDVPQAVRDSQHLIIVGQPGQLPILEDLEEVLPANFDPETGLALEDNMRVLYDLPPGTDVGYLQLMASPWNVERVILNVLGSTPRGADWAGLALTTVAVRNTLTTDFAATDGRRAFNAIVRLDPQADPGVRLVVPPRQDEEPTTTRTTPRPRARWIMPAILGSIGLMGLVILIVILNTLRRWWIARRRRR